VRHEMPDARSTARLVLPFREVSAKGSSGDIADAGVPPYQDPEYANSERNSGVLESKQKYFINTSKDLP
jgi:hypothetical protein